MKEGDSVKILSGPREGQIGKYAGTETTLIGVLHRVEFYDGTAGLFKMSDLKVVR